MLLNRYISRLYLCRTCLCKLAGMKLKFNQVNYMYEGYRYKCSNCQQMSHIIKSIKLPFIYKLITAENIYKNFAYSTILQEANSVTSTDEEKNKNK